ncbi:MFS transporter [Streptomyces sp. PBH53]|uniref:MFS transporter n=1 Tax=Streptomyces sp. PBH53 TaxID=1577075 RepID=UPI001AD7FB10|nr:MFS transporter [Streptomyces sp. PBH53]
MALSTLLHTVGTGLVITLSAVYFTRIVGVSVGQLGLGMAVSAAAALGAGIPLGKLAECRDPKRMLVALLLCQGLAIVLHVEVTTFIGFLGVTCLLAFVNEGANAVRSTLIANAIPPERRVRARALLRTITNVGFAGGAVLAGVALSGTDPHVYRLFLVVSACFFGLAAGVMACVPSARGSNREGNTGAWTVLRDRPYLAVAVTNAFLQMYYSVFEIAVPLWIATRLNVPHSMISVLFILNTGVIVALQMPIGARFDRLAHAGRLCTAAGIGLAVACLLIALSPDLTDWQASALLVMAGLIYSLAEVLHTTGSWTAGFELAPEVAQGQYQGVFTTGGSLSQLLGPVFVSFVILSNGASGWLLAAASFGGAGLLMHAAIARATRAQRHHVP